MLWRWHLMAEIPEELFELLLHKSKPVPSTKALAAVAMALRSGETTTAADRCPRCGIILRIRRSVSAEVVSIVNDWLASKSGGVP